MFPVSHIPHNEVRAQPGGAIPHPPDTGVALCRAFETYVCCCLFSHSPRMCVASGEKAAMLFGRKGEVRCS